MKEDICEKCGGYMRTVDIVKYPNKSVGVNHFCKDFNCDYEYDTPLPKVKQER